MTDTTAGIDWSLTTFEGSRRAQLRRWSALTVRQRLEALDEMTDTAMRLAEVATAASGGPADAASAGSPSLPLAEPRPKN